MAAHPLLASPPALFGCFMLRRHDKLIVIPLLVLAFLASGCIHKTNSNNLPLVVDDAELKAIRDLVSKYRQDPSQVTQQNRNDLIERIMGVSDDHYISLRNNLLKSRNTLDFLGEVTSTTVSAVAAIVGDADTKSMLSTASTLTQSTKTSIDKAFYNNNSTEAIISKMDALRATKRQTITKAEGSDLKTYGLEAALGDIRQYDDAGTVPTALIAINADAGADKADAEHKLHELILSTR